MSVYNSIRESFLPRKFYGIRYPLLWYALFKLAIIPIQFFIVRIHLLQKILPGYEIFMKIKKLLTWLKMRYYEMEVLCIVTGYNGNEVTGTGR